MNIRFSIYQNRNQIVLVLLLVIIVNLVFLQNISTKHPTHYSNNAILPAIFQILYKVRSACTILWFLFLFFGAESFATILLTCSCRRISCCWVSDVVAPLVLCVFDVFNYLSSNSFKSFFNILACLGARFEEFHSVLISYFLALFWLYNFLVHHIALVSE